ncbi:MAG: PIN domain-containing protein [Gemmatimonadaceae bacterium]
MAITEAAAFRRGCSGKNLTSDAHLAALAMENGAELVSTDADFARFRHLRLVNPLRPT